jgi:hypothetical protein
MRESNMAENDPASLPHFQSLQKLVEYFNAHNMGEHGDLLPEAQFKVDLKKGIAWFPLTKT